MGGLLGRRGFNELRVRDSILCLAKKCKIDPNELLDTFIEAWKHGKAEKAGYLISCRQTNAQSGIFLVTKNEQVVSQFPIDIAVLQNPDGFRHFFHGIKLDHIEEPDRSYLTIDALRFRMRQVNLKATVIEKPLRRLVTTRWGEPSFVSNVRIKDDTGSIRLAEEQAAVAFVASQIETAIGHGAFDGALLFMGMGAIGEPAEADVRANVAVEAGDFLGNHVPELELANAGCIDDVPPTGEGD